MEKHEFRLGARIVDDDGSHGIRVREAITEPFTIEDKRLKEYQKHYPLYPSDQVWRLEMFFRNGAFHNRLSKECICTVKDFVAILHMNSEWLKEVGEDEFAHMLANILKENNVDSSGIRFDANARTALAFITLRADGEREFMFSRHPSADMLLSEAELDKDLIKKASIFHYGSIGLIEEPCRSTLLAATEIAKQSGCILSYDPNLRVPLWPSEDVAREGIMSIWSKADVIKVSEDEITFLTGNDDDAAIEKLYHPNLKLLIVTKGAGGCRYHTKESKGRVDSHKVDAVDTTGAGDAFVAGLLNSLASDPTLYKEEEKLREALVFANGCGALTVMEKGAIPSLPTKEKVLKFLK